MWIIESIDADRHHISFSKKSVLPSWSDVKAVREKFCKKNTFYVMVLPPEEFYVNLHKFCFHLWEVKSKEEIDVWSQM